MSIKNILVVDDSKTETMIVTKMLIDAGFSVKTASNAEHALLQLKEDKPDLILMDVVMPGKSGFQLTRILARDEALGAIPIILCSSKNQETDRLWGLRQGAREYITKPVNATRLVAAIQRIEAQQ
jgi:twitching motility two-component system response regulator PilH